jgi:LmbE family N-acetylglucosaminyl deacetylase
MNRARCVLLVALVLVVPCRAQRSLSGTAAAQLALERLNVLGSALMVAAHPDDENTALLAYLSRGRKVRTGYLSLTRGEGGQNLIGPEQGHLLGVIRTHELLAARQVDGAEQFFTRAVDFGYSKSADETLQKWGREQVLGDIVRVIRKFRPDVIILRFSGTPRDGHGQHQASAMLGKEAFAAAGDPNRFPEQLNELQPWKTKRLVWNVFSFNREQAKAVAAIAQKIEVDVGQYDPLLGYSYTEIAGQSRSMHQSQGMGSAERRGSAKEVLAHVAGEPAKNDLFDGVEMHFSSEAGALLKSAADTFDPRRPESAVPLLLKARPLITIERKRRELDETIGLATGMWLDASIDRAVATAGETVRIRAQALNRSAAAMKLALVVFEGAAGAPSVTIDKPLANNVALEQTFDWKVAPSDRKTSVEQPVPDPLLTAHFRIVIEGETIEILRPVLHRYVDKVRGELTRPFAIVPSVSVSFIDPSDLFPTGEPRAVDVRLRSFAANISGQAQLELPSGWRAEPERLPVAFGAAGSESVVQFRVTPPDAPSIVEARAKAETPSGVSNTGVHIIDYPHIPVLVENTSVVSRLTRADVKTTAKHVGYIMGAGDWMPDALRQLGCDVTLLDPAYLAGGSLARFDAIVAGVRAYNVRQDLRGNQQRLMDYVRNGGTYIVQYNVLDGALDLLGPYPLKIGRDRVSVEEVPVTFLSADHPLLNQPNRITAADFAGWVQERGLYFAASWDPKYEAVIATSDPGEKPLAGGLLYARVGKGAYIFTAYSWFRQLPAGVPGAYRIFANLLSAGKAQ